MDSLLSRRALLAPSAPARKTTLRPLGKTGLQVTSLGFGCMTTSDATVIERAAGMGINYFDTARSYQNGNNERMVGAALKGKRDTVFISSKTPAKTGKEALADLDTSLSELQTDHLDVWFLHNRNTPEEVTDELLEAQATAKKAGKIRFAGVSAHFNMPEMLQHLVQRGKTDVALMSYNFTMKPDVTSAIQAARKAGMGVVAMKVLAGGYARIQRGDRLYGKNPEGLTSTLKQEGAMLSALKWALKNESVDTAIVCMTDTDQLDENYRAMSEPFSSKDNGILAAQMAALGPDLLPDVRKLRRRVREGNAGSGRSALPDVRGRLRSVSLGPRALSGIAGGDPADPLLRLRLLLGGLREWRRHSRPHDQGAKATGLTTNPRHCLTFRYIMDFET